MSPDVWRFVGALSRTKHLMVKSGLEILDPGTVFPARMAETMELVAVALTFVQTDAAFIRIMQVCLTRLPRM
jgi:hypothetical protein